MPRRAVRHDRHRWQLYRDLPRSVRGRNPNAHCAQRFEGSGKLSGRLFGSEMYGISDSDRSGGDERRGCDAGRRLSGDSTDAGADEASRAGASSGSCTRARGAGSSCACTGGTRTSHSHTL